MQEGRIMNKLQIAARKHRDIDMLIQNTYSETSSGRFKGCSIGCLAKELGFPSVFLAHRNIAIKLNFPVWILFIADEVFEGLHGKEQYQNWHVDWIDAASNVKDWLAVRQLLKKKVLKMISNDKVKTNNNIITLISHALNEKAGNEKEVRDLILYALRRYA